MYESYINKVLHLCYILIKITQCQDLVTIFLQNHTTDFDETLHVAWAWSGEGFGTSGRSGYSPVQKRRPEAALALRVCQISHFLESKINNSHGH